MRNLPLTFDCMYCSQKLGEDFAKFCGLLRIYELYQKNFTQLGSIIHIDLIAVVLNRKKWPLPICPSSSGMFELI